MNDYNEAPATGGPAEARTGFCQECGRGLSAATLRRVGANVFCVPCALRQAAPGWQPVPPVNVPGAGMPPITAPHVAGPNPARAAVLGLIPGVGAMYNGQYAKGALHLVIFVLLLSLADHLYWGFYWFVWGWVFYQAFDAYHTARARRDGLPPPNPFGWNDIGDRLGFVRPPGSDPAPAPAPPAFAAHNASPRWAGYPPPPSPEPPPYRAPVDKPSENPYTEPPVRSASAAYDSPDPSAATPFAATPFAATPFASTPFAATPFPPTPPALLPGMHSPYSPTFTGGAMPPGLPIPLTGVRRFPLGALWLIGLGLLFLLGNLVPEWRLSGRWLVPLLLAAIGVWSALRRWEQLRSAQAVPSRLAFAGTIVGPALLLSVAALLALDAGNLLSMRRSWPALLVVWGGLLSLQRTGAPTLPLPLSELPGKVPAPVRSTSGTGSLGL